MPRMSLLVLHHFQPRYVPDCTAWEGSRKRSCSKYVNKTSSKSSESAMQSSQVSGGSEDPTRIGGTSTISSPTRAGRIALSYNRPQRRHPKLVLQIGQAADVNPNPSCSSCRSWLLSKWLAMYSSKQRLPMRCPHRSTRHFSEPGLASSSSPNRSTPSTGISSRQIMHLSSGRGRLGSSRYRSSAGQNVTCSGVWGLFTWDSTLVLSRLKVPGRGPRGPSERLRDSMTWREGIAGSAGARWSGLEEPGRGAISSAVIKSSARVLAPSPQIL